MRTNPKYASAMSTDVAVGAHKNEDITRSSSQSRKRTFSKGLPDKWETASGDLLRHRVENPLHAPYLSSTAVGLSANARRKCCFPHYQAAHWLLSLNTWVRDKGWWVLIVLIINTKEASQTLGNEAGQQHRLTQTNTGMLQCVANLYMTCLSDPILTFPPVRLICNSWTCSTSSWDILCIVPLVSGVELRHYWQCVGLHHSKWINSQWLLSLSIRWLFPFVQLTSIWPAKMLSEAVASNTVPVLSTFNAHSTVCTFSPRPLSVSLTISIPIRVNLPDVALRERNYTLLVAWKVDGSLKCWTLATTKDWQSRCVA